VGRPQLEALASLPGALSDGSYHVYTTFFGFDILCLGRGAGPAGMRTAGSGPITGPRCLWVEIATGPRPIEDVITRLNDGANAPNPGERMLWVSRTAHGGGPQQR
jgi:hypothetical protein